MIVTKPKPNVHSGTEKETLMSFESSSMKSLHTPNVRSDLLEKYVGRNITKNIGYEAARTLLNTVEPVEPITH